MASAPGERMSREDWKKKQELDELRKSGAIEPERDADGNEINPHIPQYMASAPWYLNASGPGLKHQKNYKDKAVAEGVAARKVEAIGKAKLVSRKRNEFGERIDEPKGGKKHLGKKDDAPRANGYDGTFEGKRDRWNGYDPNMYLRVMKKADLQAEERKKMREQLVEESLQVKEGEDDKPQTKEQKRAAKKAAIQNESSDSSSSDDEEEAVDADKADVLEEDGALIGQQIDEGRVGMQTRVSVRNLRIREDTAKYLRNLDVKSAYYDPKTRSMRSNPNPETNPAELDYAGDNFVRYTGDTRSVAAQQLYEFEAYQRGQQVHMLGAPTQAEKLHEAFKEKKDSLVDKQREQLLAHYGGQEHTEKKLPKQLALGQTEAYVEYAEDGTVIKGQEKVILNTKYEEDKLVNNHSLIWGSLWHNGKWGYGCCGQFIRNSYCTGETGRKAFASSKGNRIGQSPLYETSSQMVVAMQQQMKPKEVKKDEGGPRIIAMGERNEGKDITHFDRKKLKEALKKEDRRAENNDMDERKRKYNSMGTADVTEEEMEAYMLKKQRGDDPLAGLGKGVGGYDFV